jgi:hypothetical protein
MTAECVSGVISDHECEEKYAQKECGSSVECARGDSFATTTASTSPKTRVQLRPVGHPSPVTQLFEYTVKAWNNQKGDHCTYRYMPSRDPAAPMEMIATVLVRIPNKQPLYVKDSKPRASRVIAQNSVAQLALEKLALDDSELAETLETIKKEQEAASRQHQFRHAGSPWRHRQYRHPVPQFYPPQFPPYFIPTDNGEGEFIPPPPPPMFYPMVPLQSFESDEGGLPQEQLMTPTFAAPPYGYGYPPIAPFMGPPEMMYYPPPPMMAPPMMMNSGDDKLEEETTTSDPTVY